VSAGRATQADARPGVTLALVPPPSRRARPRLSRPERLRRWCWHVHGEIYFRLRFRVLGRVLQRAATRRFREKAWLAGFAWTLGPARREPYWAGMLDEFGDGNQAGITAYEPVWRARLRAGEHAPPARPPKPGRVTRHLPVSRAEAARIDRRVDEAYEAMLILARAGHRGRPAAPPRVRHLVAVDPSAWQEGAR